jgi:hypothetical protein
MYVERMGAYMVQNLVGGEEKLGKWGVHNRNFKIGLKDGYRM